MAYWIFPRHYFSNLFKFVTWQFWKQFIGVQLWCFSTSSPMFFYLSFWLAAFELVSYVHSSTCVVCFIFCCCSDVIQASQFSIGWHVFSELNIPLPPLLMSCSCWLGLLLEYSSGVHLKVLLSKLEYIKYNSNTCLHHLFEQFLVFWGCVTAGWCLMHSIASLKTYVSHLIKSSVLNLISVAALLDMVAMMYLSISFDHCPWAMISVRSSLIFLSLVSTRRTWVMQSVGYILPNRESWFWRYGPSYFI